MATFFAYLVGIVVVVYVLVTGVGFLWALAPFVVLAGVALVIKNDVLGWLAAGLFVGIASILVLMDVTSTKSPFQFVVSAMFLLVLVGTVVWCAYFAADETHAQKASRESR
jgi:hypothetical protein